MVSYLPHQYHGNSNFFLAQDEIDFVSCFETSLKTVSWPWILAKFKGVFILNFSWRISFKGMISLFISNLHVKLLQFSTDMMIIRTWRSTCTTIFLKVTRLRAQQIFIWIKLSSRVFTASKVSYWWWGNFRFWSIIAFLHFLSIHPKLKNI